MADFKKINAQIYAKTATTFSPDTIYWKKLGVSVHFAVYDLWSRI